jgi:hypothetical protein
MQCMGNSTLKSSLLSFQRLNNSVDNYSTLKMTMGLKKRVEGMETH